MVANVDGYTINEALDTDYDLLIDILCENAESKKDEIVDLSDFVKSI